MERLPAKTCHLLRRMLLLAATAPAALALPMWMKTPAAQVRMQLWEQTYAISMAKPTECTSTCFVIELEARHNVGRCQHVGACSQGAGVFVTM
jgi:hypothetical protein